MAPAAQVGHKRNMGQRLSVHVTASVCPCLFYGACGIHTKFLCMCHASAIMASWFALAHAQILCDEFWWINVCYAQTSPTCADESTREILSTLKIINGKLSFALVDVKKTMRPSSSNISQGRNNGPDKAQGLIRQQARQERSHDLLGYQMEGAGRGHRCWPFVSYAPRGKQLTLIIL